jgi:hypothetical protein
MTVEEELQGGIRNALERGIPLEGIMKSFINAGYSEQVVRAAATAVASGIPIKLNSTNQNAPPMVAQPTSFSAIPTGQSSNVPSRPAEELQVQATPIPSVVPLSIPSQSQPAQNKTKIYLLVGVLILLLVLLGASILFREQLTSLFS